LAGNRVTDAHTGSVEQVRQVPRVTQAAIDAGHDPVVERLGNRFRLVCSCGWKTAINATRKNAFLAVGEHVWEVGHAELRRRGDTPKTDVPHSVGGRA